MINELLIPAWSTLPVSIANLVAWRRFLVFQQPLYQTPFFDPSQIQNFPQPSNRQQPPWMSSGGPYRRWWWWRCRAVTWLTIRDGRTRSSGFDAVHRLGKYSVVFSQTKWKWYQCVELDFIDFKEHFRSGGIISLIVNLMSCNLCWS